MAKYRDLDPLDPLPATFIDALTEYVSTGAFNFALRIKAGSPAVLEVPAGAGDAQVGVGIDAKWRFNDATVEAASPGGGAARILDVYVTAEDNEFFVGPSYEEQVHSDAFALAIVEHDAAPVGVELSRKVGEATWDGAAFTAVRPSVGAITLANLFSDGGLAALAGSYGALSAVNRFVTETDPRFTKTVRETRTFTQADATDVPVTGKLGRFVVAKTAGETVKLLRAAAQIDTGTSVSWKLQRNGADMAGWGTTGAPIVTDTDLDWTDPADIVLADGDVLAPVMLAGVGSPKGLSINLVFERTV